MKAPPLRFRTTAECAFHFRDGLLHLDPIVFAVARRVSEYRQHALEPLSEALVLFSQALGFIHGVLTCIGFAGSHSKPANRT